MRRFIMKCAPAGCAAMLAACDGDPTGADAAELRRAMDQWTAQGIDDYRMTIARQGGMIAGGAIITVRDGAPVSVQVTFPGEGMPASFFERFDTVEELFHIVEVAHSDRSHRIDAEYHPQFGVPMDVYVDPAKNVVDEEYGFRIQTFEVL